MKPVTSFAPYLVVTFRLKREYCPVDRNSDKCPCGVLLKGTAQKLVPATLPVLVERKTFSKSTKPPGVKSAPPMRKDRGDSFGFCTSPCTTAVLFVLAVVLRAAFTTLACASCSVASCRSKASICFCCWAIASFCSAIACRRFWMSLDTFEESEVVPAL